MWQDGHDTSEDGAPVRLYQPILYSKPPKTADATASHIGGTPTYFSTDTLVEKETPRCTACQQELLLLLQLYNPDTERTLYVFGCNQGSCVAAAFDENQFSVGGAGRFVCRHSQPGQETALTEETETINPVAPSTVTKTSPWGTDESDQMDEDNGNDWDVSDGDDNIEDVEAMVAAMEMNGPVMKVEKTKPTRAAANTQSTNDTLAFSCFEIHGLQEPASIRRDDAMDDDDVGMMGGSTDNKKIQQMLARYMMEEEDPDIIAAIQGSSGGSGGNRGEKDERLPAEDRAMLAFTDRIKRSPRQIVRYARGGIPLWSVPIPKKTANKSTRTQHRNSNTQETSDDVLTVPNCPSCGSDRQFECELIPSLLGVLDVDKHARNRDHRAQSNLNIDELMSREYGGMNWGALAVYTCKANCETGREDFVIVQDSIDGNPEKRAGATDDTMVVDDDMNEGDCDDEVDGEGFEDLNDDY